jgi:hypothetical protein
MNYNITYIHNGVNGNKKFFGMYYFLNKQLAIGIHYGVYVIVTFGMRGNCRCILKILNNLRTYIETVNRFQDNIQNVVVSRYKIRKRLSFFSLLSSAVLECLPIRTGYSHKYMRTTLKEA